MGIQGRTILSGHQPSEVNYIKAHDIMSRNILTLQQDQEMRELIGP